MSFSIEYLCHNNRAWRELADDAGRPIVTEDRRQAEALAGAIWSEHRRPARVLNQAGTVVYCQPANPGAR